MKDKQRFISSVIVSLIAGFIYYQFGQDIQQNFERSINAVLSSNDTDQYLPEDCEPFNSVTKNSGIKVKNKKPKFYSNKRNTKELILKDVIPTNESLSGTISNKQASIQRAVPDKNIDFTAELKSLIIINESNSFPKQGKVNKSMSKSDIEIADTKEFRSKTNLIHKDRSDLNSGKGFEYNFMMNENLSGIKIKKNVSKSNYDCRKKIEVINGMEYELKYKTFNNNKNNIQIVVPKHKTKVIIPDKDVKSADEVEAPEINIQIEDSEDDTM